MVKVSQPAGQITRSNIISFDLQTHTHASDRVFYLDH